MTKTGSQGFMGGVDKGLHSHQGVLSHGKSRGTNGENEPRHEKGDIFGHVPVETYSFREPLEFMLKNFRGV